MPSALPTVGYSELLITSLLPTTEAVKEPCQSSGAELGVVLSMYRMYMLPTRRQRGHCHMALEGTKQGQTKRLGLTNRPLLCACGRGQVCSDADMKVILNQG